MTTYNHAYTIAFSVGGSTAPAGEDVSPTTLREAVLRRLAALDDDELEEAVGAPYDSYEEEGATS